MDDFVLKDTKDMPIFSLSNILMDLFQKAMRLIIYVGILFVAILIILMQSHTILM